MSPAPLPRGHRAPKVYGKNTGVKPEWANLPRRRCDNCGKRYKPSRPLARGKKYGFCKDQCRREFHYHGGSYRKILDAVEKILAKRFEEIQKELNSYRVSLNALETKYAELTKEIKREKRRR